MTPGPGLSCTVGNSVKVVASIILPAGGVWKSRFLEVTAERNGVSMECEIPPLQVEQGSSFMQL